MKNETENRSKMRCMLRLKRKASSNPSTPRSWAHNQIKTLKLSFAQQSCVEKSLHTSSVTKSKKLKKKTRTKTSNHKEEKDIAKSNIWKYCQEV